VKLSAGYNQISIMIPPEEFAMTHENNSKQRSVDEIGQEVHTPSAMRIAVSVLAAAIGVQKRANLEKDFAQSSPIPFIVAGVVFTALFVASLVFVVALILNE